MVQFDELPVEIQEKMIEHQVAQGNPRNPDVFRKSVSAMDPGDQGMNWCDTPEGEEFWNMVTDGYFDVFFQKYPKKEVVEEKKFPRMMLVWDNNESKCIEIEVHAFIPTLDTPWITKFSDWKYAKEIPTKTPREIEMEALQVKIQELQDQFNKLKSAE